MALREAGLRDHHGQLQPRDGVDRLRHLATACTSSRSPARTCWRSSSCETPRGRDRAVRRADPAAPGGAAAEGGGEAAGHQRRRHRPGRGPPALRRAGDASWACARPAWGTAHGLAEARKIAEEIGYPVMVRPSYVLGGRAMEIVHDASGLEHFVNQAFEASRRESLAGGGGTGDESAPILVDQFLRDAIEVDVDVVADGQRRDHRRRDGAHRGGRHPLGRLGLRPAPVLAGRRPPSRRSRRRPGRWPASWTCAA